MARDHGHITQNELFQLLGTMTAELHSARLRAAELEAEVARLSVQVMQIGGTPPDGAFIPGAVLPGQAAADADTVPPLEEVRRFKVERS